MKAARSFSIYSTRIKFILPEIYRRSGFGPADSQTPTQLLIHSQCNRERKQEEQE